MVWRKEGSYGHVDSRHVRAVHSTQDEANLDTAMIIVDQIIKWPSARPPFDKGSYHLTTDGDLEELHAFAARIGLRRAWFQEHSKVPHYDLTPSRRVLALYEGAVFVEARQQAIRRRVQRASVPSKS